MLIKAIRVRRNFRRELAKATPLIDGKETKAVARAINYNPEKARDIIDEKVVPWEPRDTFPARLLAAL